MRIYERYGLIAAIICASTAQAQVTPTTQDWYYGEVLHLNFEASGDSNEKGQFWYFDTYPGDGSTETQNYFNGTRTGLTTESTGMPINYGDELGLNGHSSMIQLSSIPLIENGQLKQITTSITTKASANLGDLPSVSTNAWVLDNRYDFQVGPSGATLLLTGEMVGDVPFSFSNRSLETYGVLELRKPDGTFRLRLDPRDTSRDESLVINEVMTLSQGAYALNFYSGSEVNVDRNASFTASSSAKLDAIFLSSAFVPWDTSSGTPDGVYGTDSNWVGGLAPSAVTTKHSAVFAGETPYEVAFDASQSSRAVNITARQLKLALNDHVYDVKGDGNASTPDFIVGGGANDSQVDIYGGKVSVAPNDSGLVQIGGGDGQSTLSLGDEPVVYINHKLDTDRVLIKRNGLFDVGGGVVVGGAGQANDDPVKITSRLDMTQGSFLSAGQLVLAGVGDKGSLVSAGQIDIIGLPGYTSDDSPAFLRPSIIVGGVGNNYSGYLALLTGGQIGDGDSVQSSVLDIDIGLNAGSTGTVEVYGGAKFYAGIGTVTVGDRGMGLLDIQGGVFQASGNTDFAVGNNAEGNGEVRVTDGGELYAEQSNVFGRLGQGTLHLSDAASATLGFAVFGKEEGGVGLGIIEGEGTSLALIGLQIGPGGNGTVQVRDHATIKLRQQTAVEVGGLTPQSGGVLWLRTNAKAEDFFELSIAGNGRVQIDETASMDGDLVTVLPGGVFEINGEASFSLGAENDGLICGTGTIDVRQISGTGLLNRGVACPGNSPGVLTILGNYTQTESGVLEIEIGGTTPGSEFDQLVVSGNADIDGTVLFKFIDGFAPTEGQLFSFLDVQGDLDLSRAEFEIQNLAPSFEYEIIYGQEGVQLQANTDGLFVPEPTSFVLLGLGGLCLTRRRVA